MTEIQPGSMPDTVQCAIRGCSSALKLGLLKTFRRVGICQELRAGVPALQEESGGRVRWGEEAKTVGTVGVVPNTPHPEARTLSLPEERILAQQGAGNLGLP